MQTQRLSIAIEVYHVYLSLKHPQSGSFNTMEVLLMVAPFYLKLFIKIYTHMNKLEPLVDAERTEANPVTLQCQRNDRVSKAVGSKRHSCCSTTS